MLGTQYEVVLSQYEQYQLVIDVTGSEDGIIYLYIKQDQMA